MDNANPSMSRLGRREPVAREMPEDKKIKGVDTGAEGDHMHEAAEKMHEAEPESKHMIVSHDGMGGIKSHGIHEDGTHEPEHGAHDHENIEELKGHLGKFFNEEENEGEDGHDGGEEADETDGNLY